jgi:hypothetical protein
MTTDVEDLLEEYSDKAEWSLKEQLSQCLIYIGRQKDNESFEDFLEEQSKRRGEDDSETDGG